MNKNESPMLYVNIDKINLSLTFLVYVQHWKEEKTVDADGCEPLRILEIPAVPTEVKGNHVWQC